MKTALLSLRMLLEAPNPKDPQDAQVARMMIDDHEYFECVAHDWAVKYAGATRSRTSADKLERKTKKQEDDDINKLVTLSCRVHFAVPLKLAILNHT